MPSKSKPESLGTKIEQLKTLKPSSPQEPIWAGPEDGGPRGGVTQSMLSAFIMCRERFRLRVVEGLNLAPSFNHRLEYGSMWHICEEALAANTRGPEDWKDDLKSYCAQLCQKYRTSQEQIVHWMNVCKAQFPVYVDYWAEHKDVKDRTPLFQEQTFFVPYGLPSGRTVYLRGRWDSVDVIGRGDSASVYLQEAKTRGDIKEEQLKRQLQSGFELQTMFYLVALGFHVFHSGREFPVAGVRYNVVRRPLSGGRHSIVQHKPKKNGEPGETPDQFYARLGSLIASEPGYFFMRWKVEISRQDIDRFCRECLDPLLESLCRWWEWVLDRRPAVVRAANYMHWRTPYGLYNTLAEGGSADVDEYLNTGSDVGLVRGVPLFEELRDA